MMATLPAVLFLGASNARASILAESLLAHIGGAHFRSYSAGNRPADAIDPAVLRYLDDHGYPARNLRPKSWDEFAGDGAPALDIVVTLSNSLIGEICPVFWTGRPVPTHWPLPDNASLDEIHAILMQRIAALIELPIREFDAMTLQMRLDSIGRS